MKAKRAWLLRLKCRLSAAMSTKLRQIGRLRGFGKIPVACLSKRALMNCLPLKMGPPFITFTLNLCPRYLSMMMTCSSHARITALSFPTSVWICSRRVLLVGMFPKIWRASLRIQWWKTRMRLQWIILIMRRTIKTRCYVTAGALKPFISFRRSKMRNWSRVSAIILT